MSTKPTQFLYNTKFGIQGSNDRSLFFCPMFDTKNVVDSAALGSGAGYRTFGPVTEKQWQAMLGDSPVSMFSWLANSGIDTLGEQKIKYVWGPRKFRWEITNQETFPMLMKIYWCRPRRDLDYNSTDYDANTISYQQGADINDLTARMLDRDGFFTYGPNVMKTQLPISFTPFQSHTWCQFFKVVKTDKIRVDAGQCVMINKKAPKWVSINDIDIAEVEYVARTRQLIPFIHAVGCPVYDSNDYKIVGTGICRLSVVYTAAWPWYQLNSSQQAYKKVDLGAPSGDLIAANARYVSKPVAAVVAP